MKKLLCLILALAVVCSIFAIPVSATEAEKLTERTYKDIPFGSAAKSHVFEEDGTTVDGINDPTTALYTEGTRDYIYDYMQGYWYNSSITVGIDSTDSTNYTWNHYPIYYKSSTTFNGSYVSLDENSCWTVPFLEADGETVKNLTYKIDPTKDIVKLVGPLNSSNTKLTENAKAAYSAKLNELKTATIDIENNSFKNIYILASRGYFETGSVAASSFKADVYYEGEATPVNVQIGIKKANASSSDAPLASVCAILNKVSGTTHTNGWQHVGTGYASNSTWYSYEIPCDVTKKVDKITFNLTATNCNIMILSALGEEPSVKDLFDEIPSTEVTATSYDNLFALYSLINGQLTEKEIDLESADADLYATYSTLKANLDAFAGEKAKLDALEKAGKKTYLDVPFGDAANANAFIEYGTELADTDDPASSLYTTEGYDYVYDFSQYYWYDSTKTTDLGIDETDSTLYTWRHDPVYYSHTATHSQRYIPLDDNNNWTLPFLTDEGTTKNLTYNIKPDKKVIQLAGPLLPGYQDMTEKAAAAYSQKQSTMRKATVDIENDNYSNLYMLISTGASGTGTDGEYFTAEIYYEGEQKTTTVEVGLLKNNPSGTTPSITDKLNAITGEEKTKIWYYTSEMGYASDIAWYTYEIPCDMTKKVDKILLRLSAGNKFITIASILAEKPSALDILDSFESTEITPFTYKAQKNKLALLDETLALYDTDISLTGEEIYGKYNELTTNISEYEAIKHTLLPVAELQTSFYKYETPYVNVNLFNPSEEAGKLYTLIFSYLDENNIQLGADIKQSETLAQESYSYTHKAEKSFENTKKVKAFAWESLATLRPVSDTSETEETNAFKVLSIGNSFSQGVHEYLAEYAKDAGYEKVITANLYIGGCSIDKHYSNIVNNAAEYEFHIWELEDGKIYRKQDVTASTTMLEGITYTDWDIITIQQNCAYSGVSAKYLRVNEVLDYIYANKTNSNARIGWHMTWGARENSSVLDEFYAGNDQMYMYNEIVECIKTQIATNDRIDFVIPAGTAIQNARAKYGDVFNTDEKHLGAKGNHIACLTWLHAITGNNLESITYTPTSLTEQEAADYKKFVLDAVANPYEITK